MDFFYDGQLRRYVTQFMRFFIGFQYKAGDGTLRHIPVSYGDMTRQVAAIIKDNSENKMATVPKIACYITGLELDRTRLSDASYVSKMHIRERDYQFDGNNPVYNQTQGAAYTVERLMPTPYTMKMKADIWTSNTDQKLQIVEQIGVFFNPSFEIQTTDNYIDWTSLSVINLETINFSSRTIPAGAESEIDICSFEFSMPVYISPPAKVKRLGVVQNIVMNIFSENGELEGLENLTMNPDAAAGVRFSTKNPDFGVLLLNNSNVASNDYNVSLLEPSEVVRSLGFETPAKIGRRVSWDEIIPLFGNYIAGYSKIFFTQPNGTEIRGTFTINVIDPTILVVSITDKPSNTVIQSIHRNQNNLGTVDAIIDPYKFNPKRPNKEYSDQLISEGTRYLVLDAVNTSENVGGLMTYGQDPSDGSSRDPYDGPDAWKNTDNSDPIIRANTIIEWSGSEWIDLIPAWKISEYPWITNAKTTVVYTTGSIVMYNSKVYKATANITENENSISIIENIKFEEITLIFQNSKTGLQYKWDTANGTWLKSFEGEYPSGSWRLDLNP